GDRDALLELQRTATAPDPRSIRKDCHEDARRIVLRLLEKSASKRYRDGHHLLEELKKFQRSLPSTTTWDNKKPGGPEPAAQAAAAAPLPEPKTLQVTQWADRAGTLSRMVSRAFPGAAATDTVTEALRIVWDVSAKANALEGEIAHQTRKLEALERERKSGG